MKILLIGGAGFIGSHTADALVARGHDVTVLDMLAPRVHDRATYQARPGVRFVFGDGKNRFDMWPLLEDTEVVYHFAAHQDGLPSRDAEFSLTNIATVEMLYWTLDTQGRHPRVILASSQAVYGEGRYLCHTDGLKWPSPRSAAELSAGRWDQLCTSCGSPLEWQATHELDRADPMSAYGLTKHAGERLALWLGKKFAIPTVALRYSIVQGARQSPRNAYSGACRIFCMAARLGKQATIYEDGNQVRDYVNVHDVVDANLLMLDRPDVSNSVFNVGGGIPITVNELAGVVSKAYGKALDPEIPGEWRAGDVRHIVSDTADLRRLGWEPRRSVWDSVNEYAAWLETTPLDDPLIFAEEQMKKLGVVMATTQIGVK